MSLVIVAMVMLVLENVSSDYCNANENMTGEHKSIRSISSRQHSNLPGTKFIGTVFKLRKTMKNSQSCAHVPRNALNFVILRCRFAEDSKENLPKTLAYVPGCLVTLFRT